MFPVHIHLGPIFFPFYEGFYFFISVVLGVLIGKRILDKNGFNEDQYWKIMVWGLLGAFIGGRLFHVVFWGGGYYLHNPLKILALWEGGISVTGGIAGAIITSLITCRILKTSFVSYFSLLAPVALIAQGVGRIGCFLNGDAYGMPTSLPWGVHFKRYGIDLFSFNQNMMISSDAWSWCYQNDLVQGYSRLTVPMHPTQLYEMLFDFIFALMLLFLYKSNTNRKAICFLYISGYSFFRFLIEYIRADREGIYILNTSMMQIFLLITAVICTGFCFFEIMRSRKHERTDAISQ